MISQLFRIGLVSIVISASAFALSNPIAISGNYGDEVGLFATENGLSARDRALGGMLTGYFNTYTVHFHNPAGLVVHDHIETGLSYSLQNVGLRAREFDFVFVFPFNDVLGIGFSAQNVSTGQTDVIDVFGAPTGESYGHMQNAFVIGAGYRIVSLDTLGTLYVGVNGRFVTFSLADEFGFGLGADLGFAWDIPLWKTQFGAVVQNIPPPAITIDDETSLYPINIKVGASTRIIHETLALTGGVGLIGINETQTLNASLGADWAINQYVSLIGGWNFTALSLGTELRIFGYTLSYAAVLNEAALNHYATVSAAFGKTLSNKERELDMREGELEYKALMVEYNELDNAEEYEAAKTVVAKMIQNRETYLGIIPQELSVLQNQIELRLKAETQFEAAREAFNDGKTEDAFLHIQEAYSLNPGYRRAQELRQRILNRREVNENIVKIDLLIKNKEYEEANSIIEYSLRLEPENAVLRNRARTVKPFVSQKLSNRLVEEALIFFQTERYDLAQTRLDEALEYWPENFEARSLGFRIINTQLKAEYDKAFAAYRNEQFEDALAILTEIENTESEGKAYSDLLENVSKLRNLVLAKQFLKLADAALEDGDFAAAEENIKKALEYDPSNPEALEAYDRFKTMRDLLGE